MRVFYSLVCILIIPAFGFLQAQDLPYYRTENARPVEKELEEKTVPKITAGMKTGANVTFTRVLNGNTGNAVSGVDNESKFGLNISAVVFVPFNMKSGIAIEPGYLLKNNAYSFLGAIDTTVINNSELHYFSTAVTYRTYFGNGLETLGKVRSFIGVGAGFNFLAKGIYHQELSSHPVSASLDLTSDYNSFNLDLLLAFGTEILIAPRTNLLFEARGGLGLTDFDDEAYSAASNSTASNSLDFMADHILLSIGLIIDF